MFGRLGLSPVSWPCMESLEFKAELRDLPLARGICRALGATHAATLDQTDICYNVPDARLIKRICPDEPTEYVLYSRREGVGPRVCKFAIFSEEQAVARFGSQPLPMRVVVRKSREIHLLGNVRIHLDRVDLLGCFVELQAMITADCDIAACRAGIDALRVALSPVLGEAVSVAYADLLAVAREGALQRGDM